jgi:hypothetical protein
MGLEAIKLELIAWLTKLEDQDTIEYLKVVKDSQETQDDWWEELTDVQRKGIEKGMKDIKEGKIVSHDQVRKKYGF